MSKMIQVRNVPDRLHRKLKERAAREGKTLSGLVLEELERMVAQPSFEEWLQGLHGDPPVRLRRDAAEYVREGREENE